MTEEQEAHVAKIQCEVIQRIESKYRRGQKEHGGNVWDRPALPDLKDEVTDLNVYLQTLESQLQIIAKKVSVAKGYLLAGDPTLALERLGDIQGLLEKQLHTNTE